MALASLAVVAVAALALTTLPRIIGAARLRALIRQGKRATAQTTLRWAIVLLMVLLVAAERFGLDVVLGAMLAGIVLRTWTRRMERGRRAAGDQAGGGRLRHLHPDLLRVLRDDPRPALDPPQPRPGRWSSSCCCWWCAACRRCWSTARVLPLARLEMTFITATTMPLLIALADIGLHDGTMLPANAAALVGAGVLSVLFFPPSPPCCTSGPGQPRRPARNKTPRSSPARRARPAPAS